MVIKFSPKNSLIIVSVIVLIVAVLFLTHFVQVKDDGQAVLAVGETETGKNYTKTRLPDAVDGKRRYAMTASMVPMNYLDGSEWKEIKTKLMPSEIEAFSWKADEIPYIVYFKDDGSRRIYPRRENKDEYFEIGSLENQLLSSPKIFDDKIVWEIDKGALEYVITSSGVKMNIILNSPPESNKWRWPVTLNGLKIENNKLISESDGKTVANLVAPFLIDAGNIYRNMAMIITEDNIEFSADLSGLKYPITIDPTVDTQVASGNYNASDREDGGEWMLNNILSVRSNSSDYGRFGFGGVFTVTGPASGDTIDSAYISIYTYGWGGVGDDMHGTIYAEDVDDAADFSVTADIYGRTRTSASVDWDADNLGYDAFKNSPDITSVVQEVVDRGGWASGNDMHIMILGKTIPNAICGIDWYGHISTNAAKLYIEYTEAAPPSPSSASYHVNVRGSGTSNPTIPNIKIRGGGVKFR